MADPHMQAQLDAAARQQGFKDYNQWNAWQAAQQRNRGAAQVAPGTTGQPRVPQPQAAPKNWLQQILTALGG